MWAVGFTFRFYMMFAIVIVVLVVSPLLLIGLMFEPSIEPLPRATLL